MSSTTQVQTTNDSSIVSKLSAVNAKYFEDPCLNMFVEKEQKRSAIINRGYYIRFKAIDLAFNSWFKLLSSSKYETSQVISLGAGFDSSYFRLKYFNKFPPRCKYIEVDFEPVMKRKSICVKSSSVTIPNFNFTIHTSIDNLVASSEDYFMLAADLRNINEVEKGLTAIKIDFTVPTMFLSECAVTYMDVKSSDALIRWIQCQFSNSAFITYEQVHPHDGFGIVMQNHFNSLGCSLKSVTSFPTLEEQCNRYKNMGWTECSVMSMFEYFNRFSDEEKQRINSLELFDEYEMWHEKCHHYVLLWACQGNIPNLLSHHCSSPTDILQSNLLPKIKWNLTQSFTELKRFGHQVNLVSHDILLLSGGFGHINKKHQRIGGLTLFNLKTNSCVSSVQEDYQNTLSKRMFHTQTQLSDGSIVIVGGRSAPKKAFEEVIVFIPSVQLHSLSNEQIIVNDYISFSVKNKLVIPHCKWRHSASVVKILGVEHVVIFGGSSTTESATNDCHVLNTKSWNWSKLEIQGDTPSSRHSHSSLTYDEYKMVITGGLSKTEQIMNSVHVFNFQISMWSTLNLSGLLPRYSHTSHYYENHIFLIGGVTSISGFSAGIAIIDLSMNTVIELSLPGQDPEYPIILSNHCSYLYDEKIIITGGGGNCFSFGTHFNDKNVIIEIKDLL